MSPPSQHYNTNSEWSKIFAAYRINFSCVHVGKYIPSTKRKVSWSFGFSDKEALELGSVGYDCRGEEYEVHLIWSIHSGKAKILWDNKEFVIPTETTDDPKGFGVTKLSKISKISSPAVIEYEWEIDSGHVLKIVAYSIKSPGFHQYNLIIDGRMFFSLPSSSELGTKKFAIVAREGNNLYRGISPAKRTPFTEQPSHPVVDLLSMDHRTLMGSPQMSGLSLGSFKSKGIQNMYKTKLESLRVDVASSIPGTQPMISQAIVNAFLGNEDVRSHNRKIKPRNGEQYVSAISIETDVLWETLEWLKWNRDESDYRNKKVAFMQEQVNDMVCMVRKKRLIPAEASQAIHEIAILLGFQLAHPLPRNTVMLFGLQKNVTSSDIEKALKEYGQIDKIGIASENTGFAICRFSSSCAVKRTIDATFRRECWVQDVAPNIIEFIPTSLPVIYAPTANTFDHSFIRQKNDQSSIPLPRMDEAKQPGEKLDSSVPSILMDDSNLSVVTSDRSFAPHLLCWESALDLSVHIQDPRNLATTKILNP